MVGFAAAFLIVSPLGGADATEQRIAELEQEQARNDTVAPNLDAHRCAATGRGGGRFRRGRRRPGTLKARLLTLAGEQRTPALRTWSAAALQLDVINVEAGKGHVHVYLPAGPGSGAITPDSAPEGSGGR